MKIIVTIIFIFISITCYAQSDDTKNLIFEYSDMLQKKIEIELRKVKIENIILEKKEIDRNKQALNINLSKYKIILNDVIKKNESKFIVSEAYFRLSLITIEEDSKNLSSAINFLKKGLKNIDGQSESLDLYIKMNYLAGTLYLLTEDYSEAGSLYKKVIVAINENGDAQLYAEEKIRSLIGKGDCDYLQLNFSSAFKSYQSAKEVLKKSINLYQKIQQNFEVLLDFRMILSSYRDGNYELAMSGIKNYSYKKEKFKKYIDSTSLKYLMNISGASLYELKNKTLFKEIAEDKIYGDFGKEIILKSFPLFLEAGESKFINEVAQSVKDNFYNSIYYYLFLKNWIEINKDNANKEHFFQVCYFSSTEISKNSLWRQKFILNKNQDDLRKEIVLKYSLPAAEFYYKQGLQNKTKISFIMSAEIYKSRIDEDDEKDNRGVLFQRYAGALFMAGNLQAALNAIDKGLEFRLEDSFLKSGLDLRVQIARELSSGSKTTTDENYQQYESAIDSFVTQFPKEPQARDGLFESAKRAENMDDFDNAKVRYERILSYISSSDDEFSLREKSKSIQALGAVLLKIKNSNLENVGIAAEFENYVSKFDTKNNAKSSMQAVNSKLAKNYYNKLNMDGKVLESADFLSSWAENNNKNPNSAEFYIDSMKTFAQLQEWKKVLLLAQNFSKLYPNNNRIFSAYFWQGKAYDNLLLFNLAAEYYVKSASCDEIFPSVKEKILAIDKAILIYKELYKLRETAFSLEIKSELLFKNKANINEIAFTRMQAANIYFNLNEYKKSGNIYLSVSKIKEVEKNIKNESKINYLIVKLNEGKNVLPEIDLMIYKYSKNKFVINSINYMNNYDKNLFNELDDIFHTKINLKKLDEMNLISRRIEKRVKDLSFSDMYALLGKLNENLSANYAFAYYHGKKKEQYLKIAEIYKIEAKKFYTMALSKSKINDLNKMEIYFQARNYFSIPENIRPQVLFQEKIENKLILVDVPVNNQINEKEEQLKQALNNIEAGDELLAISILDKLIFEEDKWDTIYLALYQFYLNKKSYTLAKSVVLKALDKLVKPPANIYIGYAHSEIALNHIDVAKKILEETQITYPKNAEILGWLGIVDLKSKQILDACKKFEKSYEISSNNASLLYNHAACLIQAQEYVHANTVLQQGISNLSTNPDFYYLKGVLESRQGKSLEASKYWENFLKFSPPGDSRQSYVKAVLSAVN